MTKYSDGYTVSGNPTRYLPFGGYRAGSGENPITDRGFTGQKENMELGLMYYNARYYVPGIGRFASADTIVPDPTNPQAYNRYSYVENSPINFNDPTGHCKNGRGQGPGSCQVIEGTLGPDVEGVQWAIAHPEVRANLDAKGITDEDAPLIRKHAPYTPLASGLGIGIQRSLSIDNIFLSAELNAGFELAHLYETNETALFGIVGGDVSLGFDSNFWTYLKENLGNIFDPENIKPAKRPWAPPYSNSVSVYVASIGNVDNSLVEEYSSWFQYSTTTVALKHGFTVGEAGAIGEIGTPLDTRRYSYSRIYGYASGYTLTTDQGINYYIPVVSYTP